MVVVSEGWRLTYSATAIKLAKLPLPLCAWFFGFEGLHRLDIAHVAAVVVFVFVWGAWCSFLRLYLLGKRSKWIAANAQDFILFVGAALLILDGVMFYRGISESAGWGGATFSVWSLIGTCLYIALTVYAAFKTVELED
jgi:hypothetical protein